MATRKKAAPTEQSESIAELRKILKPGTTIYCVLRHEGAAGMNRSISLVMPVKRYTTVYPKDADGNTDYKATPKQVQDGMYIRDLTYAAARAMGRKLDKKHGGIRINGCGMDMGFALVYDLGMTLWPNGTPKPHGTRNGEPDRDGGYALKSTWL